MRKIWRDTGIWAALACLIGVLYARVVHYDFITIDDLTLIKSNPNLYLWKSWEAVPWAFQTFTAGMWRPLVHLSFILDYQFYGLQAGGYHLTNVILFALVTGLFYLTAKKGSPHWTLAALAAGLFALHPMRVESVAWIANRSDVLSGLFWMLVLLAYFAYVQKPNRIRYSSVLFLYMLAILTKPTMMTLPFILILFDWWPLRRGRKIKEKIPLFILAAALVVITVISSGSAAGFQLGTLADYPILTRFQNAVISTVLYLGKTFVPYPLYFSYPYPESFGWTKTLLSLFILLLITYGAYRTRKTRPYLLFGWLWFLITLLPMMGWIQVGFYPMADRRMFFPHMGFFAAFTIAGYELIGIKGRLRSYLWAGGMFILLGLFGILSARQVGYWKDSITLYRYGLSFDAKNYALQKALCLAYTPTEPQKALAHCREAVRMNPDRGIAWLELGRARMKLKQFPAAMKALEEYLSILIPQRLKENPEAQLNAEALQKELYYHIWKLAKDETNPENYYEFANFSARLQLYLLATDAYLEALQIDPGYRNAHINLANTFFMRGQMNLAEKHFATALFLDPDYAETHYNYAVFLAHQKRPREAREQLELWEQKSPTVRPDKKARLEKLLQP